MNFGIGDHILLYGKPYKLNQLPEPTKEGERRYTYDLKLEGLQYDLIDAHYHLPEDAYGETYYSDLAGHLQVLMWNINRIFPGKWVLGEYPENTGIQEHYQFREKLPSSRTGTLQQLRGRV